MFLSRQMRSFILLSAILSCLVILPSDARPPVPSTRHKRVSDQRLAELETMLALAKMRSRKYPVGFGLINIDDIGRKKRSVGPDFSPELLQQLDTHQIDLLISDLLLDLGRNWLSEEQDEESQTLGNQDSFTSSAVAPEGRARIPLTGVRPFQHVGA